MTEPPLEILDSINPARYSAKAAWVLAWLSHQIYQQQTPEWRDMVAEAGATWIPISKANHVDAALVLVGDFNAVLVFKGTEPPRRRTLRETITDWRANFRAAFCPGPYGIHDRIHCGFNGGVADILPDVSAMLKKHGRGRRVWITGHSKGGAEAMAAAAHLLATGTAEPVAVYTYGSPRVGNAALGTITRHCLGTLARHQHGTDPVPLWPHVGWLGWNLPGLYRHAGDLIYFPPRGQKPTRNPNWLRLHWLRWQGFRGGLWQLMGDRVKDHGHAVYLAICETAANTTNKSSEGKA